MSTKKTILVVDDEPINQLLVESILEDDYRVLFADSGAETRSVLANETVDLILLDVLMPGEDGFSVCSKLQQSPATRDIPVIFVTALTDHESEARGIAAGAVDFIQKPLPPLVLLARVQAHLDLAALRHRLSDMLDERTAEIEYLRQKAEDASDIKSTFIRNMHDVLKNPLSSVVGFGQLMLDEDDLTTMRDYARIIVDSGRRIARLLAPMMEFVEFDHARLAEHQERVDLTLLLLEAGGLVEPVLAERRVSLRFDFDQEAEVWIVSNLAGLRRAVFELLTNAVKHSPAGGEVRLTFWLHQGNALIEVHDDGPGIPEAMQSRVFEPFDRLGERIGDEGLGLGLALTKRIVDGLDGQIGFVSRDGEGTTFTIELAAGDGGRKAARTTPPGKRDRQQPND